MRPSHRRHWRVVALTLLLAFAAQAGAANREVLDLDGRSVDPLQQTAAKAAVLVFQRTDCPISNRYAPEIERLDRKFSARGISFWLIYPDGKQAVAAIRQHLKDYRYHVAALRDPGHVLVRRAKVQVTPEVAVFVAERGEMQLIYHGRIDDRYVAFGKERPAPTTHDLEQVLTNVADGRIMKPMSTPSVGCYISDLQ